MKRVATAALSCVLLMFGCSEDSEKASGPADGDMLTTDEDEATAYTQPGPWSTMTTPQRFEFMQKVVVPEMGALFKKANPNAEVTCSTCHGKDAQDVMFKMPNGLSPINVADFPLTESDDPKIAAAAQFMQDEVVPAMAGLLEVDVRSMENPMGFGCFGCHARDESPR